MLGKLIKEFEYKNCKVYISDLTGITRNNEKLFNVDIRNYEYDDVFTNDMGGFDILEEELEEETPENMAKNYIDFVEMEYGIEHFLSLAYTDDDPVGGDFPFEYIRCPRSEFLRVFKKGAV